MKPARGAPATIANSTKTVIKMVVKEFDEEIIEAPELVKIICSCGNDTWKEESGAHWCTECGKIHSEESGVCGNILCSYTGGSVMCNGCKHNTWGAEYYYNIN